jgi:hypothetical protein
MVMATAKVAYATRTGSPESAPTVEMALGGEDRDDWEGCSEVLRNVAPQDAPWGNGVPPIIEIRPGPPNNEAYTCSTNYKLLTSMVSSCVSRHSLSRRYLATFDKNQPTCAFIGGACMTQSFYGNADMFAPLMTPTPRAQGQAQGPPPPSSTAWSYDPLDLINSATSALSSWFVGPTKTSQAPWNREKPTASPGRNDMPWGPMPSSSQQQQPFTVEPWEPSSTNREEPPYQSNWDAPQAPQDQYQGGYQQQQQPPPPQPYQDNNQPYGADPYRAEPYGREPVTSIITVTVSSPTAQRPAPPTPVTQTVTLTLSNGQGY